MNKEEEFKKKLEKQIETLNKNIKEKIGEKEKKYIEYRVNRSLDQLKNRLFEIEAEFIDNQTTYLVKGRLLREYVSIMLLGFSNFIHPNRIIEVIAPYLFDSFTIEDNQYPDESKDLISKYNKMMNFLLQQYSPPKNSYQKQ